MSQAGRYATSVTPPPSSVLTLTGNVGGPVGPDGFGNIDVVGSGSVSVTGNPGTNTLTISVTGSGLTWIEVLAGAQAMAVDTGYIANFGTPITFTLPMIAAQGTIMRIAGKGAGGYLIAQNAGQTIFFGTSATTTGAGGSLTAADFSNTIELLCITADTDFRVLSSVGNFTVV
jgi:hypothetical protein